MNVVWSFKLCHSPLSWLCKGSNVSLFSQPSTRSVRLGTKNFHLGFDPAENKINSVWKLVAAGVVEGSLRFEKASVIALIKTRAQTSAFFLSRLRGLWGLEPKTFILVLTRFPHHDHLVALHTEDTKDNTRLFPVSCMHQIWRPVASNLEKISTPTALSLLQKLKFRSCK